MSALWQAQGRNLDVMTTETAFIEMMRALATDTGARGLLDDVAVLPFGVESLIITKDVMVESVHWLQYADPADVAWKLLASNLSDLAAKGARPVGVMLGYMLGEDGWDRKFSAGLGAALVHYDVALLGGDTVRALGKKDARSVSITALGMATCIPVPSRSGVGEGDTLYVTGTLGDAKAGYDLIRKGEGGSSFLRAAFSRPVALIADGQRLAPFVTAMMDVSDGLLLDASRMADASGLALTVELDDVPLSADYIAQCGDSWDSRIAASTWGDDYQLLFAANPHTDLPVAATAIGRFSSGNSLKLRYQGEEVPMPVKPGYEHG